MFHTPLTELPFTFPIRPVGTSCLCCRSIKVENREDLYYIRDAYEDCVYYVSYGGGLRAGKNTRRIVGGDILKIGDQIIFNGTDEYGFDMGIVTHVGKDDFQIEYIEFLNSPLSPIRNLNRLPQPDDFSKKPFWFPVYGGGKALRLKMTFKKYNEQNERTWYLVLHSQTEEEYVEEIGAEMDAEMDAENDAFNDAEIDAERELREAELEIDSEIDVAYNLCYPSGHAVYEISIRYHCCKCQGDSPMARERCRRDEYNAALTAYTKSAENAANGEGEYTNNATVDIWEVCIDGNNYHIDYNNVLYSWVTGGVLGYAKPSSSTITDELFEPVFFGGVDRPSSPAPPTYPNPPNYEESI